ncbi:MAG: DegT/DnrJ/EryC1/StrS family aminotransferase [Elusimicrobia bacterium]|nr:DegT/DnrJ/EryC1/StrS family aminotransferase [Candidatus Obscuribacterium magneticum]
MHLKDFWSFLGGPNVRKFEGLWAKMHDARYAISVNSATSGLTTALLAAGIQPGEEVITTPFTFTATATSIVLAQAIPVFADIDIETFCLDPSSVEEKIHQKTAAVMPVHILGNAGYFDQILKTAQKKNLLLIEDSAQSPGGTYKGKPLGSFGDAGVFSFQETKNVMTGEGGMITTSDPRVAEKCRLIRNHGESIPTNDDPADYLKNVIGYNFRMTELTAALGWIQTNKLPFLNKIRRKNGLYLRNRLTEVAGDFITPQKLTNPESFAPYCAGFRWNPEASGLSRDLIAETLRSEGIPVATGYPRLLSENPLFTRKIAFGSNGWPFINHHRFSLSYGDGRKEWPNATRLQYFEYLGFFQVGWPNTEEDMEDIVSAFEKIMANTNRLRKENEHFRHVKVDFISGRR